MTESWRDWVWAAFYALTLMAALCAVVFAVAFCCAVLTS